MWAEPDRRSWFLVEAADLEAVASGKKEGTCSQVLASSVCEISGAGRWGLPDLFEEFVELCASRSESDRGNIGEVIFLSSQIQIPQYPSNAVPRET